MHGRSAQQPLSGGWFAKAMLSRLFGAVMAMSVVGDASAAGVSVRLEGDTATLENGILSATVRTTNANLISLQFRGLELLSRGQGYWNVYGNIPGHAMTERKPPPAGCVVTRDPARTGGHIGEIALRFPYRGESNAVPLDLEIRYAMRRDDPALYCAILLDHPPEHPPFDLAVGTACWKLNPEVFDFLSVDRHRQRLMPTGEDWVRGEPLNLREARRMTTGVRRGEVEHKYDYNVLFAETPAWGWSSTRYGIGLFVVNPTIEYLDGGPAKVDYVGHIDGKPALPADPTLLFIWHSSHYGGRPIQIRAGERWRKLVGPFALHGVQGTDPVAMWEEAIARARREQAEWPYEWIEMPDHIRAAGRGTVIGRLVLRDPQVPHLGASDAWVGLAHPAYTATFARGATTIDWQTDGKHYQHWTRCDAEGRFTIARARPGVYTLHAFCNGVLGVFSRANVCVEVGATNDLRDLVWTPPRYGRPLWEIGIPNRSAEEFRHGDHFWQWGLYHLYPEEFPHDVDFMIGRSDWRREWNYAQPPRPDGKGGWSDTTWRIRFELDAPPTGVATLRLAICGARGGPVDVAVNGTPIGGTGELPESGVMHRDGIRAISVTECNLRFDASLLRSGTNTIALTKRARTWTDGVLYDYLRLELEEDGR